MKEKVILQNENADKICKIEGIIEEMEKLIILLDRDAKKINNLKMILYSIILFWKQLK